MGTVTIRSLDDAIIERVRLRAKALHRPFEAALRESLSHAVRPLAADEAFRLPTSWLSGCAGSRELSDTVELLRGRCTVTIVVDASIGAKWRLPMQVVTLAAVGRLLHP